jgi:hypothetical protein
MRAMKVEVERLLIGVVELVIEPAAPIPNLGQSDAPTVLEIALAARAKYRCIAL